MAVLGHKAPTSWWRDGLIRLLEFIINSTFCEPVHGSPFWAMHGFEPRTALSVADWTAVLNKPGSSVTYDDLAEIIAEHHARLSAVQGRVSLATSLAQALTKRAWDEKRKPGQYAVGDTVLVHRVAPNRLLPYFTGPYRVVSVSADRNFVTATHMLDGATAGPLHVSRLLRFNATRATAADVAEFQCEEGQFVVAGVIEHRTVADGLEFHVRWRGTELTTWLHSREVKRNVIVRAYCAEQHLELEAETAAAPARRRGVGRRGVGRGGKRAASAT
jgi:hypothetical protein